MAREEFWRGLLRPARLVEFALLSAVLLWFAKREFAFPTRLVSAFDIATTLAQAGFALHALFAALALGIPVVEDAENRVLEVLLSTPLQPREYAAGKFLGGLAGRLVVTTAFWLALLLVRGVAPDGRLLVGFVLLTLPAITFVGGAAFAAGLRTSSRTAAFGFGAIVTVTVWTLFWNWTPSWLDPTTDLVLCWLDPSGYRWLHSTFYSVPRGSEYYATTPIAWSIGFVLSRAAWVAAGCAAAAVAIRRFAPLRSSTSPVAVEPAESLPATPQRAMRPPGWLRGIASVCAVEYRAFVASPGLVVFALLIAALVLSTSLSAVGAFDAPLLLTSGNAVTITQGTVTMLVSLLAMCYTVEALGRERGCGLDEIHATLPLRPTQRIVGKLLAVLAMAVTVLLFIVLVHAVASWIQGAVRFEVAPFVVGYGAGALPAVVLWVSVTFCWFAILRRRVGSLTMSLLIMGSSIVALLFRFDPDSILNWFGVGVSSWSDLGSMISNAAEVATRVGRLLLVALAFALVGWAVGRAPDARGRASARYGAALAWACPLAIAVASIAAILQPGKQDQAVSTLLGDAPERGFTIRDVELSLAIDPRTGSLRSTGTIQMQRYAPGVIDLWGSGAWTHVAWTMDGRSVEPLRETTPSYRFPGRSGRADTHYFFPETRSPGDSVAIGFEVDADLSGTSSWEPYFARPAGVVLAGSEASFMPGLREPLIWEPPNPTDRDEHGITEPLFGNRIPFTARIAVTSPAEYTCNSVGRLVNDTVTDGRRTRTFRTEYPVIAINIVGARYAVRRGAFAEVYYHPGHAHNVDTMLRCLDRGHELFSRWFHPYPWQALRLNEFPGNVTYAQGYATNIHFSESIGFLARPDPRVNLPFMVTAHELAHQWWGNMVVPGRGDGANVLSEGLAHFSTILLTEACQSECERVELCKRFEQAYLQHRDPDNEQPLAKARVFDRALVYEKGGWVFWMLLHEIGRDNLLAGLSNFITEYHNNEEHPLLPDLFAVLRRRVLDATAFEDFVHEWFESVVLPSFEVRDTSVEAVGSDFVVRARVANVGTGRVRVVVAAMAGRRFDAAGRIDADLRRQDATVVLGAGDSAPIELRCAFSPDRIVVDPDVLVLQLGRTEHHL